MQPQILMWVVFFYLNLGSTPAWGPSMFHFSLLWWWGFTPTPVPSQLIGESTLDPYLCCTFRPEFRGRGEGQLLLQLQSHLSPTWADYGVHSRSRAIFVLYLLTWIYLGGEGRAGGPLWLQLQSHSVQPELLVGVNSSKIWSQLHFFVYRNLSAAHDWITLSTSNGQWVKTVTTNIYIYIISNSTQVTMLSLYSKSDHYTMLCCLIQHYNILRRGMQQSV